MNLHAEVKVGPGPMNHAGDLSILDGMFSDRGAFGFARA